MGTLDVKGISLISHSQTAYKGLQLEAVVLLHPLHKQLVLMLLLFCRSITQYRESGLLLSSAASAMLLVVLVALAVFFRSLLNFGFVSKNIGGRKLLIFNIVEFQLFLSQFSIKSLCLSYECWFCSI